MWYKQLVKQRMELMWHYKTAYPEFSYKDMVNHFNDTQKFPDGGIKNNLFNRTFRDKTLMKQEILNETPVLNNVMNTSNMNINYAHFGQKKLLKKVGHNPEYFDKDNNQNQILDNMNDTDEGSPYRGDINLPEGIVKNPNPGEFTTLINKRGMNRDQIKQAAKLDFISHSMHYDPEYQKHFNDFQTQLYNKYGEQMIKDNGGTDAYIRGLLSNSQEYDPYKKELEGINTTNIYNYLNQTK